MKIFNCFFYIFYTVGALTNKKNPFSFKSRNNIPIIRPATVPLNKAILFQPGELVKDFQLSFLREAELKHGRLAMIAAVIIPNLEFNPTDLGINALQNQPVGFQLMFLAFMLNIEFVSMIQGWEHPTKKPFTLKEDYQPGDLGFGLWNKDDDGVLMDMELNHCRLAMIGTLGMIVQEIVTQKPLF